MWVTIIFGLLKVFGPLIVQWFENWLANRMDEAASRLPAPTTFGSEKESHLALLDEVLAGIPWHGVFHRRMVSKIRDTVAAHPDLASIPVADLDAIKAMAA